MMRVWVGRSGPETRWLYFENLKAGEKQISKAKSPTPGPEEGVNPPTHAEAQTGHF